jgi:uncharacterized membrane protein YvbJ
MFCPSCGAQNSDHAAFCAQCRNSLSDRVSSDSPSASPTLAPVGAATPSVVLYAGFWKRLVAMLVDWLVLAIGGFLIGIVIGLVFMSALRTQVK